MARKKKKKQSKSIYCLIAFICAVCLLYEPVAGLIAEREQKEKELPVSKTEEPAKKKAFASTDTGAALPSEPRLEIPGKMAHADELILYRRGYAVSYNRDLKIPNWVAWELTPAKLIERESRSSKFLPDPDLPADEAVTTDDYKGAGLDRGHMCPAGDNRWHWRAMQESFYMTNICPQDHNLNRGDWKELEEACRRWAQEEGRIYIVCGPVLYKKKHRTIGKRHFITVPEAFFKVILCTESNPPKAIGFIYKNRSGNHPMDSYVNTIDQVERITGIDFFPALPDKMEKEVEATYDLKLWKMN
ncbi:DNA/RNA non-specific endonuclease [Bacteroides heparinolyticus]|uniref:DNA/RNA non-specific endonuclease n=1 Tax=Prevotella heparinolytica TaxID=28113 RepID=UPI0035A0E1FD